LEKDPAAAVLKTSALQVHTSSPGDPKKGRIVDRDGLSVSGKQMEK
jgi:hypothetical protein